MARPDVHRDGWGQEAARHRDRVRPLRGGHRSATGAWGAWDGVLPDAGEDALPALPDEGAEKSVAPARGAQVRDGCWRLAAVQPEVAAEKVRTGAPGTRGVARFEARSCAVWGQKAAEPPEAQPVLPEQRRPAPAVARGGAVGESAESEARAGSARP